MTILDFIILSLACYRLTHLIVFDKIVDPFRSLFVTRSFAGPIPTYTLQGGPLRRSIGRIINCFWCAGIWVAAVLILGYHTFYTATIAIGYIFALSAVQSLIEQGWTKSVGWPEMAEAKVETSKSLKDNPDKIDRLITNLLFVYYVAFAIFGAWLLLKIMIGG